MGALGSKGGLHDQDGHLRGSIAGYFDHVGAVIGNHRVSMGLLGNNLFETLIRDGMDKYVRTLNGVTIQVEDAGGDVNRQLDQVRNFIASGVSAIVIDPADSSASPEISRLASDAHIPLVYVNIEPDSVDKLLAKQAFVGPDERESGTMEAQEICRVLKGKGTVAVMVGDVTTQAARQRTRDVYDVMTTPSGKRDSRLKTTVGTLLTTVATRAPKRFYAAPTSRSTAMRTSTSASKATARSLGPAADGSA